MWTMLLVAALAAAPAARAPQTDAPTALTEEAANVLRRLRSDLDDLRDTLEQIQRQQAQAGPQARAIADELRRRLDALEQDVQSLAAQPPAPPAAVPSPEPPSPTEAPSPPAAQPPPTKAAEPGKARAAEGPSTRLLRETLQRGFPTELVPAEPSDGLVLRLGMLAEPRTRRPRWVVRPEAEYGFDHRVDVTASVDTGVELGYAFALPVTASARVALLRLDRSLTLSLGPEVQSKSRSEPTTTSLSLLATQPLGSWFVDLNAGYRLRWGEPDAIALALGVSRPVGRTALAIFDGWYEARGDGERRGGVELGAAVELAAHSALQLSAGFGSVGRRILARVVGGLVFEL